MNVVFMHVGDRSREAEIMVRSAKRFGHTLIQLTDDRTHQIPGVDLVQRWPFDSKEIMYWRACRYADCNLPGLYVDTDVVFRVDPAPVWELDFDVAVTKRVGVIRDERGVNILEEQPYNGGVVFVKHPTFWRRVARDMRQMPKEDREWWGDQKALYRVSKSFRAVELPCSIYNYTPKTEDEPLEGRWLVHYKGPRKEWMRD